MKDKFLALVRIGIGHPCAFSYDGIDWDEVETLAEMQGLLGVVFDGVLRLTDSTNSTDFFPLTVKLRWMGKVMHGYEQRYALYRKAVADLAAWYHAHGYRMMLLKGLACGLDWPKPEHRPYGDIDIYLFGQYKEADTALSCELGIKVDNSHHHHTVFEWHGFTVENHYDFVNVHVHRSSRELEKIFKELALQDTSSILPLPYDIVLPLANLHALFLMRHMVSHFTGASISMRQVLDWAFFVKAHGNEVNWPWLIGVLNKYHMKEFFDCVNVICVEDLGFPINIFPSVQFDHRLKEKVLNDILDPAFATKEPQWLIKRIAYKYRRWKGNAWKHELCYNESRRSAFFTGVWAKLLKPASI